MQRTAGFPSFFLSWSTRHLYIFPEISRKTHFIGFPEFFLVYHEKTPEAQPEISPGFPGTSTVSWNSSNIGVYLDFKVIFSSWFTKKKHFLLVYRHFPMFSWFTKKKSFFLGFPGLFLVFQERACVLVFQEKALPGFPGKMFVLVFQKLSWFSRKNDFLVFTFPGTFLVFQDFSWFSSTSMCPGFPRKTTSWFSRKKVCSGTPGAFLVFQEKRFPGFCFCKNFPGFPGKMISLFSTKNICSWISKKIVCSRNSRTTRFPGFPRHIFVPGFPYNFLFFWENDFLVFQKNIGS